MKKKIIYNHQLVSIVQKEMETLYFRDSFYFLVAGRKALTEKTFGGKNPKVCHLETFKVF